MTAPAASRHSVTVRSRLYSSGYWREGLRLAAGAAARGMSGPPSTSADELLERAAAVFVVVELVVALACRREQHDLAGLCRGARPLDRGREVAALDPRADLASDRRAVAPDQVDARAVARRLAQRLEVLTLAAAPEDQVDRLVEAGERHERRVDVRRLGVVDVEHAADRRDLLEAVLDAGERAQRGPDGVWLDPARQRDRRGCRGVGAVVGAAQPDLVVGDQRLVVPPQLAGAVVELTAGPEADAPRAAPEVLPPQAPGRDRDVVVALPGEGLELGGQVGVERAVAIEVVGRDVQEHRALGRERDGVLELERRQL